MIGHTNKQTEITTLYRYRDRSLQQESLDNLNLFPHGPVIIYIK